VSSSRIDSEEACEQNKAYGEFFAILLGLSSGSIKDYTKRKRSLIFQGVHRT
jgi:hypothetical protein